MLSTHKVILAETFSPTFVGLTFRVSVKTRWNQRVQMSVTLFPTRTINRNDSQFPCSSSHCKVSTSKNYLCLMIMIVCVFSGSCGDLLHPSKPHPHCYWSKEILPNIPFLNFENLRLDKNSSSFEKHQNFVKLFNSFLYFGCVSCISLTESFQLPIKV